MKNIHPFKTFVLAAAASLGLASSAFAQTSAPVAEPATITHSSGLLGQTYASLGYGYVNFDNSSATARTYSLSLNQYVRDGVDTVFEYNYTRSSPVGNTRLKQHDLLFGGRFYTSWQGIKPYAEVGVGWVWQKAAGFSDNSFAWGAGVGAEIEVAAKTSLTPFVRYTDITEGSDNDAWEYGVKANHWLTEKVALQGSISRDDDRNMFYRLGVNVRY